MNILAKIKTKNRVKSIFSYFVVVFTLFTKEYCFFEKNRRVKIYFGKI